MVEPIRKQTKGQPVALQRDESSHDSESLVFTTTHSLHPFTVDLNEFAAGKEHPDVTSEKSKWKGAFNGRELLIREMFGPIKTIFANAPETTITTALKPALRTYWRLLDSCEDIAPVNSVADLDDLHGALQLRANVNGGQTRNFVRIANMARDAIGLPPLYWTAAEGDSPIRDSAPFEHIGRLYHELKHRVFGIFRRWEEGDLFAQSGKSWAANIQERPQNLKWTFADVHATYRGLVTVLEDVAPSANACKSFFGTTDSMFTREQSHAVYGLYPSRHDVEDILMLFLLRTGWNGAVALNLDGDSVDSCIRSHPTSPMHDIIFAVKDRAKNIEQVAIGLAKSSLSPPNLIRALLVRTEPLRIELRKRLEQLLESPHSVSTAKEIALLRRQIKSPFLYVGGNQNNRIHALDVMTYFRRAQGGNGHILTNVIKAANDKWNKDDRIDERLTLKQFRDAYVSYAYQNSGYSWLVAQLAAGHSSAETLKTYLRRRRWKEHGERKIGSLLKALWQEIEERRVVDPAILFAMVQRGEITDEQRRRWQKQKDRTRVGTGCRDFRRPPRNIAPHHVDGTGCRIQRCTLCSYAIVFDDSVAHLARRLAELRALKLTIPLVSWAGSSFEDELEATQITLHNCFEEKTVKAHVVFWAKEIQDGRHRPLSMEGEYGTS
ncbi:hypothetical protein [Paraburkholderia nemoris]|uniref:hypothetical protein n=1 Tax=Paraburkholderia nemoris TaxID=2793076 RepID=UPI001B2583BD|nr:hypothetical protein [Paraburkholderia nemoris]CAE6710723.1 hypothetical protein LMG22931_01256 [Paraburkholderia nemoris]